MPSANFNPVILAQAVTDAGETKDINAGLGGFNAGRIVITNVSGDRVFVAIGGAPPPATFGDGRGSLLPGQSFNWNNVFISELSFICAAGESAQVEIQASIVS